MRVGFGAPSVTVSEGSGEFMMCVRKNITASPITVFMSPMDGTAKGKRPSFMHEHSHHVAKLKGEGGLMRSDPFNLFLYLYLFPLIYSHF